MDSPDILLFFGRDENVKHLSKALGEKPGSVICLEKLSGSAPAFIASTVLANSSANHLFILNETEEAIYFFNDLENLLPGKGVMYYPAFEGGHKKEGESANLLRKTEV